LTFLLPYISMLAWGDMHRNGFWLWLLPIGKMSMWSS